MKIIVDTNMLVRSVVRDDRKQAVEADKILKKASVIAIAVPVFVRIRMGIAQGVWLIISAGQYIMASAVLRAKRNL